MTQHDRADSSDGAGAPAKIEDVAASADVSVATTRRALYGGANVDPATRERVREAAEKLRYRPDRSAASRDAGQTKTVAVAVPILDRWYFSQVMAGAEAVLSEAGYDSLLFKVDNVESRRKLLAASLVDRADGLILASVLLPENELMPLLRCGLKVVSVGLDLQDTSTVMVDDRGIAQQAVTHLVELGHRDIAMIGTEVFVERDEADVSRQRRLGYEAALAVSGIERRTEYVVSGNFTVEGGSTAMATLLKLRRRPTAVLACSDEMAYGAMRELARRGMDVPTDMSIVGIDNHEFSDVVGLSTFHQEVVQHGAVAGRLMLDRLSDSSIGPGHYEASTEFVDRGSTARLPYLA